MLPVEVCARIGSVAATYALEHLGGQSHAYTLDEFTRAVRGEFRCVPDEPSAPDAARTVVHRLLTGSCIAWAALLPLAPFAASQHAPAPFWYASLSVVYGAGSVLCHQLPERSFCRGGAVAGLRAVHRHLFRGGGCCASWVWSDEDLQEAQSVSGFSRATRSRPRTRRRGDLPTMHAHLRVEHRRRAVQRHPALAGAPLGAVVAFVVCQPWGKLAPVRATAAEETQSGALVLLCVASWAVPGAGHLWLGRRNKGLLLLVALPLMFAIGVAIRGRIFPFDLSDTSSGLAAVAELGIGVAVLRRAGDRRTAAATCARSHTRTATRS